MKTKPKDVKPKTKAKQSANKQIKKEFGILLNEEDVLNYCKKY